MAIRGPHGPSDQPAMHASAPPMHAPCMHPRPHQHATSLCICRWGRQDVHRGVCKAHAPQALHAAWECLSEHWHAAACMYAYTHATAGLSHSMQCQRGTSSSTMHPSCPHAHSGQRALSQLLTPGPGPLLPPLPPGGGQGARLIPAPLTSSPRPLLDPCTRCFTLCPTPAPPASHLHPLPHTCTP